ncbi:hypothetical protein D3Z38_06480 [Clostridiales bacterium]|nr:hypothetical protein [Clostridiales bacterium]
MERKTLVKPLAPQKQSDADFQDPKNSENLIKIRVTKKTISEEQLVQYARKKMFIMKPKILSVEFFYQSCWRVVLDFKVAYFKETRADRGQVEFIVDPRKGCGANEEELALDLISKRVPLEMISDVDVEKGEAERKAKVDARWKVLLARYKKPAELELAEITQFYRPYYMAKVSWGSKTGIQYLAADDFANYFVYN